MDRGDYHLVKTLLQEKSINPVHLLVGDSMNICYDDGLGNKTNFLTQVIDKPISVDYVAIYQIEDDFNISEGFMAIVGRK